MYHEFITDCLTGEATLLDLESYVDYWHDENQNDQSLQEFLGLTTYEYTVWLQQDNDDVFRDILSCRRKHITLEDFLIGMEPQKR